MSILVCSIILFGSVYIYFNSNGTPWGEKSFERKVEQYINNKYPDMVILEQKIRYSLVDMHYHSTVHTKSGIVVEVSVGYNNGLQDNYNQ